MRDLQPELTRAIEALKEIERGTANNGVPYYLAQIRTIARDALDDMQQMQYVEDEKLTDRDFW